MLQRRTTSFKFLVRVAAGLAAVSHAVFAEERIAATAQALLDETRTNENLAGMTAGVARDGEIVWLGASGYSDVENQIAAIPDMVHRIASISKPMTATAVMQLVQYDRIRLEDPLRKFVPEWPESPLGEIEIIHLLTHTSGIKHYTGRDNRPFTHHGSLADAVSFIMNRENGIAAAPGDRYLYSTYGYTTLGLVIERASGVDYGAFMRDYVWLPAGMRDTSLEVKGVVVPNKAKLYRHDREGNLEADDYTDLSVKYPGGGIQSTAGDLLRFAMAFEAEKPLTRSSMDRMMQVPEERNPRGDQRVPYGVGWLIGDAGPLGAFIRHDGGQSGTSTNLLILRERRIGVSVLCNVSDQSRAVQELTWKLARLAAGVPESAPEAE